MNNPDFTRVTHFQRIVRIHRALLLTGGNRVRAARMLGIGRATLYRECQLEERRVAQELQQEGSDGDQRMPVRGATAQKMSNAAPAGRSYRSDPQGRVPSESHGARRGIALQLEAGR
jgi:hypothetical protein